MDLRDGDDRLSAGVAVRAFAGDGNDVLEAGGAVYGEGGDDTLTGGAGADTLNGGDGRDRLAGGPGDDVLEGDTAGAYGSPEIAGDDVIDGGEGTDTLTMYAARGVIVDLGAGVATGGRGQHDTLASLEHVRTGDGDDVLIGTDGGDELSGGPGNDVIDGRGGDDVVDGGSGRDRLSGGDGDDRLLFSAASCGAGADIVKGSSRPKVPADCERIALGGFQTDPSLQVTRDPVRWRRSGVAFTLTCPPKALARCHARLVLRTRRGTLLASSPRTVRVRRGQSAIARLRPTAAGRRLLDGRRLAVTVGDRETGEGWLATYGVSRARSSR